VWKMRVSLSLAQAWEIICLPGCLSKVCLRACLTVLECLYLRVSISRMFLAAARSAREGE